MLRLNAMKENITLFNVCNLKASLSLHILPEDLQQLHLPLSSKCPVNKAPIMKNVDLPLGCLLTGPRHTCIFC